MYNTASELLSLKEPDRVDKLAQRAYSMLEAFRKMVAQARQTQDVEGANLCAQTLMLSEVVLQSADAVKHYDFMRRVEVDPDPLSIDDAEEVMNGIEQRYSVLRRFVHPDAATGAKDLSNVMRGVPFGRASHGGRSRH